MAFCTRCGTELQETDTVCPNCGNPIGGSKPAKKKLEIHPYGIISFVFSCMAFLFGFILTTTFFVTKRGIAYTEYCALVPAMVGLGFGLLSLFGDKCNKLTGYAARAGIVLALFTCFYVFVGFMVVAG